MAITAERIASHRGDNRPIPLPLEYVMEGHTSTTLCLSPSSETLIDFLFRQRLIQSLTTTVKCFSLDIIAVVLLADARGWIAGNRQSLIPNQAVIQVLPEPFANQYLHNPN